MFEFTVTKDGKEIIYKFKTFEEALSKMRELYGQPDIVVDLEIRQMVEDDV